MVLRPMLEAVEVHPHTLMALRVLLRLVGPADKTRTVLTLLEESLAQQALLVHQGRQAKLAAVLEGVAAQQAMAVLAGMARNLQMSYSRCRFNTWSRRLGAVVVVVVEGAQSLVVLEAMVDLELVAELADTVQRLVVLVVMAGSVVAVAQVVLAALTELVVLAVLEEAGEVD